MKAVFILFDSLNRSALSCSGGSISAPNFGQLANRGVRSDNHFAGSLPCMPARRDIQTSRLNFFASRQRDRLSHLMIAMPSNLKMAARHEAPSGLYKIFDLTLPKTPSV